MPYPKKTTKSRNVAGFGAFTEFFQKNWVKILVFLAFIVGLLALLPFIKQLIEKYKQTAFQSNLSTAIAINSAENNTSNPDIIAKKTEAIQKQFPNLTKSKIEEIKSNAFKMAIALGTNVDDNHLPFNGMFDFYNVSAWGEDEKTAVSIAKKHTGTFPVLEKMYYSVATKSRSLRTDLLKLLSKDDLNEIREAHKKYGNYKFL